jgi:hypothetical protein
MYDAIRETTYPTDMPFAERPAFKAFQDAHAAQAGSAMAHRNKDGFRRLGDLSTF